MTIRRTIPILLAFVLAGCGLFGRGPKNEFYSLEPIASQTLLATVAGAPIGIDGVELPPGVDRREIVLRGADHRFEVRGTQQWASPLEEMVIHTLAFDLASRLAEGMVVLPGQASPGAKRGLYVTFEDLAAGPDPVFVLDARWSVTTGASPTITGHERITVNLASTESAAIAAGMSEALATLADRIAAGL